LAPLGRERGAERQRGGVRVIYRGEGHRKNTTDETDAVLGR
jgi:hypothetical protein